MRPSGDLGSGAWRSKFAMGSLASPTQSASKPTEFECTRLAPAGNRVGVVVTRRFVHGVVSPTGSRRKLGAPAVLSVTQA